jgi:Domain of unknown function (DUF5664)
MSVQAKRFNSGKAPLSRILEFKGAIEGVAQIMEFGDKKYGRLNWQLGLPHTEVADSLLRHLLAWASGEDMDPESGHRHLDHVTTNALFLSYFSRYCDHLDDRSPAPTAVAPRPTAPVASGGATGPEPGPGPSSSERVSGGRP